MSQLNTNCKLLLQLAGTLVVVAGVVCTAWPGKSGGSVFTQVRYLFRLNGACGAVSVAVVPFRAHTCVLSFFFSRMTCVLLLVEV